MNKTYCGDTLWNRRLSGKFHRVSRGKAVGREKKLSGISRPNPEEDWIVIRDTHEPLISRRLFVETVRLRREKETTKN